MKKLTHLLHALIFWGALIAGVLYWLQKKGYGITIGYNDKEGNRTNIDLDEVTKSSADVLGEKAAVVAAYTKATIEQGANLVEEHLGPIKPTRKRASKKTEEPVEGTEGVQPEEGE